MLNHAVWMLLKDCEVLKAKGAIKMYKNIHY